MHQGMREYQDVQARRSIASRLVTPAVNLQNRTPVGQTRRCKQLFSSILLRCHAPEKGDDEHPLPAPTGTMI